MLNFPGNQSSLLSAYAFSINLVFISCLLMYCNKEGDDSECVAEKCYDGIDNDCDGNTDCWDRDCGFEGPFEYSCYDGVDNDCDGNTDCWDQDCGFEGPSEFSCNDGKDNDCDGNSDEWDSDCSSVDCFEVCSAYECGFHSGCDCGSCESECGNGVCESGETCLSCPADCGSCEGECTSDAECGSQSCGSYGSCTGFSTSCDETGTQSRECSVPRCVDESCTTETINESQSCTRDTDGESCDSGKVCHDGECMPDCSGPFTVRIVNDCYTVITNAPCDYTGWGPAVTLVGAAVDCDPASGSCTNFCNVWGSSSGVSDPRSCTISVPEGGHTIRWASITADMCGLCESEPGSLGVEGNACSPIIDIVACSWPPGTTSVICP